nr:uncharacterized protein LOC114823733 [Malus domestica]
MGLLGFLRAPTRQSSWNALLRLHFHPFPSPFLSLFFSPDSLSLTALFSHSRSPSHSRQYIHELDEKPPSLIYKAKKSSADLDCRKMIKNSFKQAHEFEKRRAESHSAIRPSVLS